MNLKESLDQFTAPVYGKTQRSPETYRSVAAHCKKHIARLVDEYAQVTNDQQLLREIRDELKKQV
jgi:trehalose/maltose hydrolase-like predicted phosphorylase